MMGEGCATLRSLRPMIEGTVKMAYIDPPYNNGERYNHYMDSAKHDEWLTTIENHIAIIRDMLSDDGSLWISIDDNEMHYLKVATDRIFGRNNFVSTIVWEHRTTRENRATFSYNNEFILVYARDASRFKESRNLLPVTDTLLGRYANPDCDSRGPWQSVSANVQAGHGTAAQFYEFTAPNGKRHYPPPGRCWTYTYERMMAEIANNNVWFGQDGNGVPRLKKFLSDRRPGLTPHTLWTAHEVGTTTQAKKHILRLLPGAEVFDTPKPESLLKRIMDIATDSGDTVLDSFLGSGTTAAVAHKLGRRYIGIDNGMQIMTHCIPRLQQVIQGECGGISREIGWVGGGEYRYIPAS